MTAAAGWYPDPQGGGIRWWDGQGWTEHTAPAPPASPFAPPYGTEPPGQVPAQVTSPLVPPYGSELPGQALAPAPSPGPRPWVVAVAVVGLVALLAASAGTVLLVLRGQGDSSVGAAPAPTRSAAPTAPTPSPSVPGATPSPPAGGSSSAGGADGAALEALKPGPDTLAPGYAVALIPEGDVVEGQRTLDGWCSMSYDSERDRVARRQWIVTRGGQQTGLSVEVVTYRTEADAAAALAEFTATTQACRNITLTREGVAETQNLLRSGEPAPRDGVSAYEGLVRLTSAPQGTEVTLYSKAVMQQSGRTVSLVWTIQNVDFSAGDLAAIDEVVAQQATALAGTGA